MRNKRWNLARRALLWCGTLGMLLLPSMVAAQTKAGYAGDLLALVRRVVANEVQANENRAAPGPIPVRFKIHRRDEKGLTTREIVQTRDGSVTRLIAVNDVPLTAEQEQAEHARLQRLLDQPEIQERRHRRAKDDAERANKLIKMMPEAFAYSYEGMAQAADGPAVRLHFKPSPGFSPPDQESRLLSGIEGDLWIDQAQERVVRFDARLVEDVDFGWGVLGRLYKGGSIHLESTDIGNHNWQVVNLKLDLTAKALMLKTLAFRIREDATDFQLVRKELSYQEAIRLLESAARVAPVSVR